MPGSFSSPQHRALAAGRFAEGLSMLVTMMRDKLHRATVAAPDDDNNVKHAA